MDHFVWSEPVLSRIWSIAVLDGKHHKPDLIRLPLQRPDPTFHRRAYSAADTATVPATRPWGPSGGPGRHGVQCPGQPAAAEGHLETKRKSTVFPM